MSPSTIAGRPPAAHRRGLLLFAHGARDPQWAEPFRAVQRHAERSDPSLAVELAFLEFMEPGLREAGAGLADRGCLTVDVVPLFLGAGGHVRKDLPRLMEQLRTAYPAVGWRLHAAVGEHEAVIAAMAEVACAMTRAAPQAVGESGAGAVRPST